MLIASALAELAERPVRLTRLAVSGAKSPQLDAQVDAALLEHPDVALIMIGANDVTSRTRPAVSVRHLGDAVRRLTEAGCRGGRGHLPGPGHDPSHRPAAAHLRPALEPADGRGADHRRRRGRGRTVSLGSALGPTFATDESLFSGDEFHPSAAGYAHAAAVLLPSVADALGVWPASADRRRGAIRRDTVRPVASAAARAASRTGSEVQPAEVPGTATEPWGGWALLRRRRPPEITAVEQAASGRRSRRPPEARRDAGHRPDGGVPRLIAPRGAG